METNGKTITVDTDVNVPIEKVWDHFTNPNHIIKWNNASDDWHTPRAENDLRVGGSFIYRMEAKDGSFGLILAANMIRLKNMNILNIQLVMVAK